MAVNRGSSIELKIGSLCPDVSPISKESHVSEVSVAATLVIRVEAESVDVLILVSVIEAVDDPIMTTFGTLDDNAAAAATEF